jgi:acid phosphatase type 7
MKTHLSISIITVYMLTVLPAVGQATYEKDQPRQVLLTWQSDPSTSMTITWRTDKQEVPNVLRYSDRPDARQKKWITTKPTTFSFEETKAWLHTIELKNLSPDKDYYVTIDHPTHPESFHFRTLPDDKSRKELVFLAGADSRSRRDVRREVNTLAAKESPDFVIFTGDFINTALSEEQWDEWFDDWHEQMITSNGRRIPIIPAIGNHEVAGGYLQPKDKAPFYINRFIVPEPRTKYVLKLSPELVLVTLDSDHIFEVTSQNQWLDSVLTAYADIKWKIVQYHVAAWPSVRDFDGEIPVKIRKEWIPILEKHKVNLVLEAHDHAYKKTVPIRNNQHDDENGIIYLGDGGWGAPIRDTKNPADYWWLDEAEKIDHFWKLTLSKDGKQLKVDPVFRHEKKSTMLEKL